jgi:predicted RNase H-like HicB family nuclease
MTQRFHSIIKPRTDGWFVGWVEEIPGTMTRARTLEECRDKLRDALRVMIETRRHEARLFLDNSCLTETLEIVTPDEHATRITI